MADDYTLQNIQNLLREIEGKNEEARRELNRLLSKVPDWVPDYVVNKVLDKWNELCDLHAQALQEFWNLLDNMGEPWTLRAASNAWSTEVAEVLSGLPGKLDESDLWVDDLFSGLSGEAYKQIRPEQIAAINAVHKNLVAETSKALSDGADTINDAVAAVESAVVALGVAYAALIAALVTCETVIGAVAGLVVFLGACGKAIYDAHDARGKLETAVTKIGSDFDKVSSNNDGFEGNSWPDVVFSPGG